MTEPGLVGLDESYRRMRLQGRRGRRIARPRPEAAAGVAGAAPARRSLRDRLPWLEIFVALQFVWGALLFLPYSQQFRPIIRALPYGASLLLLVLYLPVQRPGRYPAGTRLLLAALLLLGANLLHATTQMSAGVAQCLFQLTIAAPAFCAWKAIKDPSRLRRVLWLAFMLNLASAAMGILQVYEPDRFMPPQFSTLAMQLNDSYINSLTYVGRDGRLITRPPGLTDMPGGSAVAGALTALLGIGLSLSARTASAALGYVSAAAVGFAVIYLTQVRSLLLTSVAAILVVAGLAFRRGRFAAGSWATAGLLSLLVLAFYWATSLGGAAVETRFLNLAERGAVQTYQESRGHFLSYTYHELLDQFPLGAGLGRWGMMRVYFGDPFDVVSEPIHVEIQLTGWLLDGGLPMWLFYGGAVLATLLASVRMTLTRGVNQPLGDDLSVIVGILALIVGMSFAGPVFNTQLGALFWFMAAVAHGAWARWALQRRQAALVRHPDH